MLKVLKYSLRFPVDVVCADKPMTLLWFYHDTQMKPVLLIALMSLQLCSVVCNNIILYEYLFNIHYLADVSSIAWNVLATAKYGTLTGKKNC